MKNIVLFVSMLLIWPLNSVAQSCANWSQWDTFKKHFISDQGRVIDLGSKQSITTSEGQSYALFFALLANDQASFEQILQWTQTHLAEGDLSTRLPAWQWGIDGNGKGKILDSNPASDSDLWIAYTLSQAAILWQERRYAVLSSVMAERIIREETAYLPNLGLTLLPAPNGFEPSEQTWKLNPSYAPLFILQQFAQRYPHSAWQALHDSSAKLILETSKNGFSPDWVMYNPEKGFYHTDKAPAIGSYNAIRVYLWASMMADEAAYKKELIAQFEPMLQYLVNNNRAPLEIRVDTGKASGSGPAGFIAALLPLLADKGQTQTLAALQQKLMIDTRFITNRYYDSVLYLFGTSTTNKRFTIDKQGALLPNWSNECR